MANALNVNPLRVDTAGAAAILTDVLYVKSITWSYEGSGAGDNAIIQDQDSNGFDTLNATGANTNLTNYYGDQPGPGNRLNGLIVPTLAGGTLFIHLL